MFTYFLLQPSAATVVQDEFLSAVDKMHFKQEHWTSRELLFPGNLERKFPSLLEEF